MSIDTYTRTAVWFYIGVFLLFALAGVVEIRNKIRKKQSRYWWGIAPCAILYSLSAFVSTSVASIAYDDISDPNYMRYAGWELSDFILHDVKTLIIWLLVGLTVYFVSKSRWKRHILAAAGILLVLLLILYVITWQPACCIFGVSL